MKFYFVDKTATMSDMFINYFQDLGIYLEAGKEITKAELVKRIDQIKSVKDNIKRIVHQTVYSSVIKDTDGYVNVL